MRECCPFALRKMTAGCRSRAVAPRSQLRNSNSHMAMAPALGDQAVLPTLKLVDLACRRGDRLLFKGVQLELPPGRIVWLRGRKDRKSTRLNSSHQLSSYAVFC